MSINDKLLEHQMKNLNDRQSAEIYHLILAKSYNSGASGETGS